MVGCRMVWYRFRKERSVSALILAVTVHDASPTIIHWRDDLYKYISEMKVENSKKLTLYKTFS